jgi:hypothetical protein
LGFAHLLNRTRKAKTMRALSKVSSVIAVLATVALSASAADARSVNPARFGGAHNSVSTPRAGSVPYNADGVPYPSGHGGRNGSPDFQLIG